MSSFIVMLAEGDGTWADGWSAISVVLFLMLVVAWGCRLATLSG